MSKKWLLHVASSMKNAEFNLLSNLTHLNLLSLRNFDSRIDSLQTNGWGTRPDRVDTFECCLRRLGAAKREAARCRCGHRRRIPRRALAGHATECRWGMWPNELNPTLAVKSYVPMLHDVIGAFCWPFFAHKHIFI